MCTHDLWQLMGTLHTAAAGCFQADLQQYKHSTDEFSLAQDALQVAWVSLQPLSNTCNGLTSSPHRYSQRRKSASETVLGLSMLVFMQSIKQEKGPTSLNRISTKFSLTVQQAQPLSSTAMNSGSSSLTPFSRRATSSVSISMAPNCGTYWLCSGCQLVSTGQQDVTGCLVPRTAALSITCHAVHSLHALAGGVSLGRSQTSLSV